MGRSRIALMLGLATGVIGVLFSLVPALAALEDSLGLRAFFRLRGQLPAPAGVVVVSIDEPAAAALNLKAHVRDWPRAYHARLIDRLVDQGASVIAFDLQFFRDAPAAADDEQLAAAIRRSGRVVLVQLLERLPNAGQDIWRQQDPIPVLADGAAALAPVPIPKAPLVSWFWTFLAAAGGEDVPTLPFVVMQVGDSGARAALADALKSADLAGALPRVTTAGDLREWMLDARRALKRNADATRRISAQLSTQQIDDATRKRAQHMAGLYAADNAAYLNFYGAPGRVCTIPYDVVLNGEAGRCTLQGAAVFVGVGRSRLEPAEQIDTYHTVYEQSNGEDLSGVELHATAFANLLDGTAGRPAAPPTVLAILLSTGVLFGGAGYWTRTRRRLRGGVRARLEAVAILALLGALYGLSVYVLLASEHVIVPVVVPLAIQLPAALVIAVLVKPVVHTERVHAVCLAADASGSTAIGQHLPHDAYVELMTEYNRTLARCVAARGGLALAPQGDGFVSLWVLGGESRDDGDSYSRLEVCAAALEMTAAAGRFNATRADDQRLPLRIGITVGAVTVSSDAERGAFEAVGDAVNLAARLQELNRDLGTSVLASGTLVRGLADHLHLRAIEAPPALKGVTHVPEVFELLATPGRLPSAAC